MSDVTEKLKNALADSYVLYVKTQNYHWNVSGPNFYALHLLFEQQYTELSAAVDSIAERLRALGSIAPGSMKEFLGLTAIKESAGKKIAAEAMVKDLQADQKNIVKTLKAALDSAEAAGDDVTVDMMTQRITAHEKNAWMLASSL